MTEWSLFQILSHHMDAFCQIHWLGASGEEDFQILPMYLLYFIIFPFWKRGGPLFEETWVYFTIGCFVPGFVEIGLVVLEKKISKFCQCIFGISLLSSLEKRAWPFIWTNLNPLYPRMLCAKFGLNGFLRRKWKCEQITDGRTDDR